MYGKVVRGLVATGLVLSAGSCAISPPTMVPNVDTPIIVLEPDLGGAYFGWYHGGKRLGQGPLGNGVLRRDFVADAVSFQFLPEGGAEFVDATEVRVKTVLDSVQKELTLSYYADQELLVWILVEQKKSEEFKVTVYEAGEVDDETVIPREIYQLPVEGASFAAYHEGEWKPATKVVIHFKDE